MIRSLFLFACAAVLIWTFEAFAVAPVLVWEHGLFVHIAGILP